MAEILLVQMAVSQMQPSWNKSRGRKDQESRLIFCAEKNRLRDEMLEAVQEINMLQTEQTRALVEGDGDFARFDLLLHLAHEKKDACKYAWISHVENHGCEEA